jgi:opacity protein-like surface antigen
MYFEKRKRSKLFFIMLTSLVVQSAYPAKPSTQYTAQPVQTTQQTIPVTQRTYVAKQTYPAHHNNYIANWFASVKPLLSQYVITLSGFQGWENTNAKQTIFLTPEIVKAYVANPSGQAYGTGELFVGIYQPVNKLLEWQYGLALGVNGNTRITGSIWDDDNYKFNNYSYNYQVRSTRISLKTKLLTDIGMVFIPWFSGSIGVGFNQAHDFVSTPTLFQALPTPGFSSHTSVAFTYAIGFGAQLPITDNWQVGIGYEFSDWGRSKLGRAPGQTQGSGPVLNQLYASSVLFNLSYLA